MRVQEALTAFMEDVISHMAGYVPLKAIAERILASYASDPFGDFKVRPLNPLSSLPCCGSYDSSASLALSCVFLKLQPLMPFILTRPPFAGDTLTCLPRIDVLRFSRTLHLALNWS